MTFSLAALVLTNLLYVAGAVVAATLLSALYVLVHRRPKSLESGIESFSRELRALAPEQRAEGDRRGGPAGREPTGVGVEPAPSSPVPWRPRLRVAADVRAGGARGTVAPGGDEAGTRPGGGRAGLHREGDRGDRKRGGPPG